MNYGNSTHREQVSFAVSAAAQSSSSISGSERRPTAWRHIVYRQPGIPWVWKDQSTLKLIRINVCQNSYVVVSIGRWPHAWRHILCGRPGIPKVWFSDLWQGKSDFLCFSKGTIFVFPIWNPLVLFLKRLDWYLRSKKWQIESLTTHPIYSSFDWNYTTHLEMYVSEMALGPAKPIHKSLMSQLLFLINQREMRRTFGFRE